MPNASGKTPPAAPCRTRPAITTSILGASALITPPAENSSSTVIRTRPLPNRSPSLPAIGVAIDALSRKPVSSHDTADGVVSNSFASAGSAGTTSVWLSENATQAATTVSRTAVGRFSGEFTPAAAYLSFALGQATGEVGERRLDLVVHRAPEDGEQRLRGERTDVLDRVGQVRPALCGHTRVRERLDHVVHEELDEVLRDRARVALDALDQVERVIEAHAAGDDLLGGGEQGGAGDLVVAVAERDQHAELLRLRHQVTGVAEALAQFLRGQHLGRLGVRSGA